MLKLYFRRIGECEVSLFAITAWSTLIQSISTSSGPIYGSNRFVCEYDNFQETTTQKL